MTKQAARSITEQALSDLAQQLEQGHSETLVTFLDTLAKFHRYSFNNVMLIAMQRPDATHVAGFNAWNKLGRHVHKGEKGITILAPITYRKDDEDEQDEIRGFKAVTVFDVSQTDGKPLPEFSSIDGNPAAYLTHLKAMITGRSIKLRYEFIPGGADGVSSGGTITIRPNQTPASEFSVLVHEFAHEMLHRTNDRPQSKTALEVSQQCVVVIGEDESAAAAALEKAKKIYGGHMGGSLEEHGIWGSPEQVIERIERHRALGCSMFLIEFFGRDTRPPAQLFAEQVAPAFRD